MFVIIRRYTERMPFEVLPRLWGNHSDAEAAIRRMMRYDTTACSYWVVPLNEQREWKEII